MNLQKYSCYEYEVMREWVEHQTDIGEGGYAWAYKIHGEGCQPYYDGIIESDEWYRTKEEAAKGAIQQIDLLEEGPDR